MPMDDIIGEEKKSRSSPVARTIVAATVLYTAIFGATFLSTESNILIDKDNQSLYPRATVKKMCDDGLKGFVNKPVYYKAIFLGEYVSYKIND